MTDRISKRTRSRNMSAVKSVSKLENKVSSALWHKGIRFRKNKTNLFGKPDISIKKYKIVIFIDSCFWHNCPLHGSIPKSHKDFWTEKLHKNVKRDKEVTRYYMDKNWYILRLWEHDLKDDFNDSIEKIANFITEIKKDRFKS